MQKVVIGSALFLGGLAAGFFIGVKFTKKKLMEDYYAMESDIRHMYAAKIKEMKEEKDAIENTTVDNDNTNDIPTEIKNVVNNPDLKEAAAKILQKEASSIITAERYSSDPDCGGPTDEDEDDEDEDKEPILEKISRSESRDMNIPYVISPGEFGENDYEEIELIYWADGILSEDRDIIEDTDSVVGPDALHSFGQYEDGDVVYVRNDARRCDYAILRDYRNFTSLPRNQRR